MPTIPLATALAVLFLASPLHAPGYRPEPPPPGVAPPGSGGAALREAGLAAALRKPVEEVRFEEVPLEEVLAALAKHAGGNVHVLWRDLAESGVARDAPITLTLRHLPLTRVLNEVFAAVSHDIRLGFEVRDGVLVIATRDYLDRRQVPRVYDVSDLIARLARRCQQDAAADAPATHFREVLAPEQLAELLRTMVAPDTWRENGGMAVLDFADDLLVVRQSRAQHRALAHFLAELRDARGVAEPTSRAAGGGPPDRDLELQAALNRVLPELQVSDEPLRALVQRVANAAGLTIVTRWDVLGDAGVDVEMPVTLRLRDLRLEDVLRRILEEATRGAAALEIRDGVLLISTREDLDRELVPRTYPVPDLLVGTRRALPGAASHTGAGPHAALVRAADAQHRERLAAEAAGGAPPGAVEPLDDCLQLAEERLRDLLRNMVAPDSWRETGGGSSHAVIYDGLLVVYQSAAGHAEIAALLAQLREADVRRP